MKIICVYSNENPMLRATEIPFGISIIATVLKEAGHEVELVVFSANDPVEEMMKNYVRDFSPDLVCFTAVSTQFYMAIRAVSSVKAVNPKIFTILGGHHASLNSEHAISVLDFDAICIGEGEKAIVELAKKLEQGESITGIPHLWIRNSETKQIEKNPTGAFSEDLSALPYINRQMWDKWIKFQSDYPSILLGRGCPFKCTYCSNHAMAQLSEGRYVRFREPENIIGEIDKISKDYPEVTKMYLEVETFGANLKASYRVFEAIAEYNAKRTEPLTFGINLALTSVFIKDHDRVCETLEKLQQANILTVNVGLESGSEYIRDAIKRPKYSNAEIIQFSQLARKYGISIVCFVLIGLPDETYEHYLETVKVCRAIQPSNVYLSIFFPYQGTDLARVAFERGYVSEDELSPLGERKRSVLDLPEFSKEQIRREYILFWLRTFHGHWPVRKIMYNTGMAYLSAYTGLYAEVRRLAIKSGVRDYFYRRYGFNVAAGGKAVTRVDAPEA